MYLTLSVSHSDRVRKRATNDPRRLGNDLQFVCSPSPSIISSGEGERGVFVSIEEQSALRVARPEGEPRP